jgi:hypothetical protein
MNGKTDIRTQDCSIKSLVTSVLSICMKDELHSPGGPAKTKVYNNEQ